MGLEIERRFLVQPEFARKLNGGVPVRQGYIQTADDATVRIRIYGKKAFLTLKSVPEGITRQEFEYEIPRPDAARMIGTFCQNRIISKIRHTLNYGGREWIVDVFLDENEGLYLAEVELNDESEPVTLPGWAEREVSGDMRYHNSQLALRPWKIWIGEE